MRDFEGTSKDVGLRFVDSLDDLTNRTAIPLVPPFDFTSMLS